MARMAVSLTDPLLEDLRRLVPVRQRSQFIAEAVQWKLTRLRQEAAARAAAGAWSEEGREDPEDEIRELRRGWEERDPVTGGRLG